jgi:hypothetical protein
LLVLLELRANAAAAKGAYDDDRLPEGGRRRA